MGLWIHILYIISTEVFRLILDLQFATAQPLGMALRDFTTACASIGLAFYMNWKLTFVIISTLPIMAVMVPLISTRIQPNIELQTARLTEAAKHIMNAFSIIETVKYHNGQKVELYGYSQLLHRAATFYTRQVNWNALQASLLRFVTLTMFVQGFWYGSTLVDKEQNASGTILTAFWSCIMATGALMQIMPQLMFLEKGRIAGHRLRGVMVAMAASSSQTVSTLQTPHTFAGDITFQDVHFAYPNRPQHLALRGANFFFAAGDITFVIGKSGSGKSTIGQLLMKFYHPSLGQVTLDEHVLANIDPHWIRKNILLVEQQSVLFNTTLRENIALGGESADGAALEDIQRATEFAAIKKTIDAMPKGFDTIVGSKGNALSGGQKQRIALARAKLRDPPVLILDESTSALDYINGFAVMAEIRKWRAGKTTIIITHDISQILPDDFLYVMKDGKVVQEGFRKALSKVEGHFQEFLVPEEPGETSEPRTDKPLPPEPVDEEGDARDSFHSLMKSNNRIYNADDPLDHIFQELRNRTSVFVPSIFTHRLGAAPTRDSTRMSQIVAPFWSVVPDRALPVMEFDESKQSSPSGTPSETKRYSLMDAPMAIKQQLSQASHRLSATLMAPTKRFSTSPPARQFDVLPIKQTTVDIAPVATIPEEDLEKALAQNDGINRNIAKYTTRQILLTVWPNLSRKQRVALIIGFVSVFGYAASTPLFAFVFSKLLVTFSNPLDRKQKALKYSIAILGIAVGDAVTIFVSLTHLQYLAQVWVNKIRLRALDCILDQPREFFDREENSVSSMAACLDHHAEQMQHILGRFVSNVMIVIVMVTTAVTWSLVSCWKLTLVLLACTPILLFVTSGLSAVSGAMEKWSTTSSEFVGSIFSETFTNIKTVRSLTLETYFRNKHQSAAVDALKAGIRKGIYVGAFYGLSQSVLLFIVALIFHYGGVLLSSHQFNLSAILQVFTLLLLSISNATMILASIPQLSTSREAAARLLRLANLPLNSHEHEGNVIVPHVGDIAFRDVKFRYPTRPGTLVLNSVNLKIPSGSCVAIVGTSGSGKSTIAALLLNLYTTESETSHDFIPASDITLSGREIRRIHTPTLRNLITIVSQTPTLFPTSISANIVYGLQKGNPLNTASNVRSAAEAAGIHDFVSSLPLGYDTIIGEGGMGLSGGQAQRIAIARAIARRPNVLILDEATSALDVESANIVRESIQNLLNQDRIQGVREMTLIIITHSKDMMKIAERIIMMDNGVVVEEGSYNELIRGNGNFAKLLRGENWEKDTKRVTRRSMMLMSMAPGVY
jgi:ATP-binding cassette subfamily B (MDR/TAP) protein 1